jgi:kumamolisin
VNTSVPNALAALGLAVLFATPFVPAAAQPTIALVANAQPFGDGVAVLGDADDRAGFEFQVALKMRNVDEFRARLDRGESISDDDLEQRYLPKAASYQAVLAWLTDNGLTVTRTYDNRLTAEVTGPVAVVRQALHVPFRRVIAEGAEFIATDAAPVVPSQIAQVIEGINGLQPYRHLNKQLQLNASSLSAEAQSVSPDAVITGNYFPAGILRVYQALPSLSQSGKGTISAILIDTFPHRSDLTAFWSLTGIPQSQSNIAFIQAVSGALPRPRARKPSTPSGRAASGTDRSCASMRPEI